MARSEAIIDKALKAALKLAGEAPWRDLTLAEIAKAAKLKLSDFHGLADKDALLDAAEAFFDKAMSAEDVDMDDPPLERLFDVIMLRFEAMEPYRDGLLSLMHYRETSPARLARLVAARRTSANWALTCAGLDDNAGAPKGIKVVNTAFAMGQAERAWRKETSGDFARTMARLDKALKSADERMSLWRRWTGGRRQDGEAPREEEDGTQILTAED